MTEATVTIPGMSRPLPKRQVARILEDWYRNELTVVGTLNEQHTGPAVLTFALDTGLLTVDDLPVVPSESPATWRNSDVLAAIEPFLDTRTDLIDAFEDYNATTGLELDCPAWCWNHEWIDGSPATEALTRWSGHIVHIRHAWDSDILGGHKRMLLRLAQVQSHPQAIRLLPVEQDLVEYTIEWKNVDPFTVKSAKQLRSIGRTMLDAADRWDRVAHGGA